MPGFMLVKPRAERLFGKFGHCSFRSNPCYPLGRTTNAVCVRYEVRDRRHSRCKSRPHINAAHCVRGGWSKMTLVIMRQKLSFVCRHIDVDRALTLATLA